MIKYFKNGQAFELDIDVTNPYLETIWVNSFIYHQILKAHGFKEEFNLKFSGRDEPREADSTEKHYKSELEKIDISRVSHLFN